MFVLLFINSFLRCLLIFVNQILRLKGHNAEHDPVQGSEKSAFGERSQTLATYLQVCRVIRGEVQGALGAFSQGTNLW